METLFFCVQTSSQTYLRASIRRRKKTLALTDMGSHTLFSNISSTKKNVMMKCLRMHNKRSDTAINT